jgi:NAD(P)-dependent dehydrogenase (short-subunit alcohol dehydrogenase family)
MTESKTWFITGASRGLGRIWTEAALERGDKVAAAARDPSTFSALVERYGSAVLPLKVDVTDDRAVSAAVEQAHACFRRLDVVVCSAGYGLIGTIEEVSLAEARANIETNVLGTLAVIKAVLPILRQQRHGHILPVSSLGGVVALPMFFQATKFAIEAIGEELAAEVAEFGIKVTLIEPGAYRTSFFSNQSLRHAAPIAAYDRQREARNARIDLDSFADPMATAQAIFAAVDSPSPPLRLILGSKSLPLIRKTYEDRLATWQAWEPVSNAAQGG